MDRHQLLPCHPHGAVEYQFRYVGQAIADHHQRHPPGQVEQCHAESGGPTKMP
jgi:hypothetical protein